MIKRSYTAQDIQGIVVSLNESFEAACGTYRDALSNRTSNRSTKELMRGNANGTTLHKIQCNFAWIMHELTCGPKHFVDNNTQKANELINHINNIAITD